MVPETGKGANLSVKILPLKAGMVVTMKKPHPCGSTSFEIMRCGADVRARCTGCGRELFWDRVRFEKAIKKLPDLPPNE